MPAKKAPARKAAAAKVVDFDAERRRIIAQREPASEKKWKAYGQEWTVKAPNMVLTAQFMSDDEEQAVEYFTKYLLAHVVKDQRPDFTKALIADEDLDVDVLSAMVESLGKVVYG